MSTSPDTEQSSKNSSFRGFPFSENPLAANGPATVVHPERREDLPPATPPSQPASGIWRRLFPPDSDLEAVEPIESPRGLVLDHFVIEERIGTGGMGAVFRAVDDRLKRVVALKILSPALSRDIAAVQRFQNEARSAARLDHDNIARVFYIGEDQGLNFIAFEYVTGTNIRDLIHAKNRLAPAEAITYTLQIALALKHTSAAGVIHRDIKPSNVIITPNDRAKLVDMGLARKESTDSVGDLTLAGTTLGTFDYISPEQAKDPRNVDVRSDIYSLGCTLYHMLTGVPPYPEGTVLQKLLDHQGKEPPDPAHLNSKVSDDLSAVVQKMMASDPRQRYASADHLIRDLMLLATSMGIRGINPDGVVWTSRGMGVSRFWERHLAWIATVAALALIVFALDRFGEQLQDKIQDPGRTAVRDGRQQPSGSTTPAIPNRVENDDRRQPSPVESDSDGGNSDRIAEGGGAPKRPNDDAREPADNGGSTPDRIFVDGSPLIRIYPFGNFPFGDPDLQPVVGREAPDSATDSDNSPPGDSVAADSTNRDETNNSANSETTASPPMNVNQSPAIAISSGDETKAYKTIEAAVTDARDGSVIELSFTGARLEPPFRVKNKKVTIRAGRDNDGNRYRPTIVFDTGENDDENATRMITLVNGKLDLINVNLQMTIDDDIVTDQWALMSLQKADQVRLERVVVSIVNDDLERNPAAVFELTTGPGSSLETMKMKMNTGSAGPPEEVEVKIVDSFLRGGCDLFINKHVRPARIDIENAAIAISGSLLNVLGDENAEKPDDGSVLDLRVSHVTCLVGDGLIRVDSGTDIPRALIPIEVTSQNTIFATTVGGSPLVSMLGNTPARDFRELLHWSGERNYYERFQTFWSITSDLSAAESETFDFEDWKRNWTAANEVDPNATAVVLQQGWRQKQFAEIEVADLGLDDSAAENPAKSGATDDNDAGADLSELPERSESASRAP